MDIIVILGTIGFFLCLFIMHRIENSPNGIRKYDENFKSLDMQFSYASNKVYHTFKKLGIDGRNVYCNFLISDFCFIICFFIVKEYRCKGLRRGKTDSLYAKLIANYGIDNWYHLDNYEFAEGMYQ